MKVLVTGEIGSGKSTAVRAAMAELGWTAPAGFFTHWKGAGRGAPTLYLETWDGVCRAIARRTAVPAAPGGLGYELDEPVFTRVALESLAGAGPGRPVVLDELGRIELGALAFIGRVAELFRGSAPVLAVIQRRALGAWRERLGEAAFQNLLEVDSATRDGLPRRMASVFGG